MFIIFKDLKIFYGLFLLMFEHSIFYPKIVKSCSGILTDFYAVKKGLLTDHYEKLYRNFLPFSPNLHILSKINNKYAP